MRRNGRLGSILQKTRYCYFFYWRKNLQQHCEALDLHFEILNLQLSSDKDLPGWATKEKCLASYSLFHMIKWEHMVVASFFPSKKRKALDLYLGFWCGWATENPTDRTVRGIMGRPRPLRTGISMQTMHRQPGLDSFSDVNPVAHSLPYTVPLCKERSWPESGMGNNCQSKPMSLLSLQDIFLKA